MRTLLPVQRLFLPKRRSNKIIFGGWGRRAESTELTHRLINPGPYPGPENGQTKPGISDYAFFRNFFAEKSARIEFSPYICTRKQAP